MVGGGLGERERHNEKAPIELGDESSTGAIITLSDSDCVGSIDAVQSRGDAKLKSAAIDSVISERQNHQVLDKELSRLLSIFPNASPSVAAANLASQLKKTSPGKVLERTVHRYMEHGVPNAEQVPHEGPKADPPQAIEKPMDVFARPNLHRVGTSNHGERQGDFGYGFLPPEIEANYNLWTYYTLATEFPRYPVSELRRVLHENNSWFAPSYKAISTDYTAALAAELREGQQAYPKLRMRPRDSTPKPHEPCYIFERELQSIRNASAEGTKLVTEELKIDIGPQCGAHMDACEGETSLDIECGRCCPQCGTQIDVCEGETSADIECGRCCPQCGTHMDASEGETSADIECGRCCPQSGTHMDASEGETSIDIECGRCCPQCGTHMDASEGETSTDMIECARCCPQCGTHMDASESEASVDIECGHCCLQCGTHMDACEGETSANIEWWLWCSNYRFEEMVQCAEGHLFCFTCLRRRIEESTSGGSQASNLLPCMDTSGCEESIPWSEVKTSFTS